MRSGSLRSADPAKPASRQVAVDPRVRERLEKLSWLMDNSIRLPTGHRIGVDGVLGLVPGVGDVIGAAVSSYFIVVAARLGLPKVVIGRMAINILIEAILGAIPLFGDLFDLAFKANARNYSLMSRYLESPGRTRAGSTVLMSAVVLGIVALLVAALLAAAAVLTALWRTLFG